MSKFVLAAVLTLSSYAAAEALEPVTPRGNPARWVLSEDLSGFGAPKGITGFDLMVAPSGAAVSCQITMASASNALDRTICAALLQRARFYPARSSDGSPVPGVWSDRVVWEPQGVGDNSYRRNPPNLVLGSPAIGVGGRQERVEMVGVIGQDGKLESCEVSKAPKKSLAAAGACSAIETSGYLQAVRDENGAPTRGIRSITVLFVPEGVKKQRQGEE